MLFFNRIADIKGHFDRKTGFLLFSGLISLLLMVAVLILPVQHRFEARAELQEAAEIMEESLKIISDHCREHNIGWNETDDPHHTGLIGPELTGITTTTGHLAAKRTTINPDFAALIVSLLQEAGVRRYDTIAVACSGSFPALLVATLSAARAMDLNPRVILSIGSSSYGATNIHFTLLDIYMLLLDHGVVDIKPVAVSPGGGYDTGEGFEAEAMQRIKSDVVRYGIPLLYEKDFQSNVLLREEFYFTSRNIAIKAFINTGGGYASMGTSPLVLKLEPGLITSASFPEKKSQGVIYSMLGKGIPVIHLLFIEAIAKAYDLPWDPATIPRTENTRFNSTTHESPMILSVSILYLIYFCYFMIRYRRMTFL